MNAVLIHNITTVFDPIHFGAKIPCYRVSAHIDASMIIYCDTCHAPKIMFKQEFSGVSLRASESLRNAVERMINYDWRRCMKFQFGGILQCQCIGGCYPKGYFRIDKYAIPFAGEFVDQLKQLLNEICQTTNAHYEVNQKEIGDGIVMQQIPTLPPGL